MQAFPAYTVDGLLDMTAPRFFFFVDCLVAAGKKGKAEDPEPPDLGLVPGQAVDASFFEGVK